MTKEISQELARRMAILIEKLCSAWPPGLQGRPDTPGSIGPLIDEADTILAALPKDDPVEEAAAAMGVHMAQTTRGGTAAADAWAIIKAALSDRLAKSEAEIRADERKKAEREIAATIDYAVAWHRTDDLATRIRAGAYRALQE